MYDLRRIESRVHRIIPSKFPTISLFDWVETPEELEQLALLEGLTNDRIQNELGSLNRVPKEDWVLGQGATPLMAAFTHIGHPSRFSDGTYGVYYAANTLNAAIKETVYHRERFYSASKERPCAISMREYLAEVRQPLVDITAPQYIQYLSPDPSHYEISQELGRQIREEHHWGLLYPSIRHPESSCVAVFRPSALTIPIQGKHFKYIWDGASISEVYVESRYR